MSRLPRISGSECIRALKKIGFHFKRQEGSHIILRRDYPYAQVTVPEHRELDLGTLRSIIRASGISVDEFNKLLR